MAGRIVILSGPSGVGKDTLISAWIAKNPHVERVITYTTRDKREGEVDGVDYHFVSTREFLEMARAGEFLEYKEVHENHYGTPIRGLADTVGRGKIAVLKIDVQGALAAMQKLTGEMSIFIAPPSMEELERRLTARGSESKSQVRVRLRNAKREMAAAVHYSHTVINDEVDRAVEEIEAIVSQDSK